MPVDWPRRTCCVLDYLPTDVVAVFGSIVSYSFIASAELVLSYMTLAIIASSPEIVIGCYRFFLLRDPIL